MTLTAVSLFAGIGGIDLALTRAGVQVVAAVEIDPAARGVIADRMPETVLFNDVCEVTGDQLRAAGFVPDRGIVAAGWPCQDLSVAGRRAGLGGARSGLFWELVRIVADLEPRWLCAENVPGLLSAVCPGDAADAGRQLAIDDEHGDGLTRGRGACPGGCMDAHGGAMGLVVGALANLGYGVAWRVLDAQYAGVPQRRRRIFFVGCLGDGAAPVEVLLEPDGGGGDSAAGGPARQGVAAVAALGASDGGADDNDATGGRLVVGALTTGVGSKGGGVRIGPEEAAAGHLVVAPLRAGNHHGDHAAAESHLVSALTTRAGSTFDDQQTGQLVPFAFDAAQITHPENRVNPKPGDPAMPLAASGQPHVAYALRSSHAGVGQGHNTTYAAHVQPAAGSDSAEVIAFDWQTDGSDRSRPNISERRTRSLQTHKRDAAAYIVDKERGLPNAKGITIQPTDVASTITADGDPAEQNDRGLRIVTDTAVRRLTPTECERLQGLPDRWTLTSFGKLQSDSARYRQLGNSVAIPVMEWIARRLVAVERDLKTSDA